MSTTPFEQIVGTGKIYIAPSVEAKPDVDNVPAGNFVYLGATDGGLEFEDGGDLEFWRDDQHQGPRKATRPEEDKIFTATFVDMTLENYARILSAVGNVSAAAGPPAIKKLPLERGFDPTEYSLLFRVELQSPYGSLPAQYYIPRVVIDGSPSSTYAKDDRVAVEGAFMALVDETQSAGDELGWWEAQTA